MLSCVSQPQWGQPPVSATLLTSVSHPHCQAESCSLICLWGGDWDHLVFGHQRMTLVTLKGILRHRLPLNEAWPPAPILSHPEFGSLMVLRLKNARARAHPSSLRGHARAAILKESPARGPRG
jgi:hypothetical protein